MTLNLSMVSPRCVLRVSDRRVSLATGEEHDALANKNVVFLARDALILISYSGLAYLEGMSTDDWIACTITGFYERAPAPAGYPTSSTTTFHGRRIGPLPRYLDLGQTLRLVRDELQRVFDTKLPPSESVLGHALNLGGWQWDRRHPERIRPVGWAIQAAAHVAVHHRHGLSSALSTPGLAGVLPLGYLVQSEIEPLVVRLETASPDEAKQLFVETIQMVANRDDGVWPALHLHPLPYRSPSTSCASAICRLLRRPHRVTTIEGGRLEVRIALTPWLIGKDFLAAPEMIAGPVGIRIGPKQIGRQKTD